MITWTVNGRRARRTTQPLADGGEAFDSLKVELPGTVTVSANLRGPDASDAGTAPALTAKALLPYATRGATGLRVRFLQSKLAALGYVVPVNGVYDVKTEFAVIAFRKVNRQARTSIASRGVFNAIAAGRGGYRPRFPGAGRHVEFDRRRQVLALVDAGGVRVFHSSSGRPRFRTPLGSFRFWHKEPGLNDRGMLHTVYFTHDKTSKPTRPACGIHGYFAVPDLPLQPLLPARGAVGRALHPPLDQARRAGLHLRLSASRGLTPIRLFKLLRAMSFVNSTAFTALLFFWLMPGYAAETAVFGWIHGCLWIALSVLVDRRRAPSRDPVLARRGSGGGGRRRPLCRHGWIRCREP